MTELERYGVAALAVTIILVLLVSLGGLATRSDSSAARIPLPDPSVPVAQAAPERPLVVPADAGPRDASEPIPVAEFAEQLRMVPDAGMAADLPKSLPATVVEASGTTGSHARDAATPDKSVMTVRYQVQHGDTLQRIAGAKLGSTRRWSEIVALNKGLDAAHLRPGQELVLPSSKASASTSAPAATLPKASPPVAHKLERATEHVRIYSVAKGDTLESIAEKQLGDRKRWRELYDLNRKRLKKPESVSAGIKLQLPEK